MGSNNEFYDKFDSNTNDVELKGDVELDFDDEKASEDMKEEKEISSKAYEVEPSTSKTIAHKLATHELEVPKFTSGS